MLQPDTTQDEELARSLQAEEMSRSLIGQRAQSPVAQAPVPAAVPPVSGTFVRFPDEDVQTPAGVAVGAAVAPPDVPVVMSPGLAASVETVEVSTAKLVLLTKVISVASLIWWVFSIVFRAWWFAGSLGGVMCPIGWWGAHKRSPLLLAVFMCYLMVSALLEAVFPFAYGEIEPIGMLVVLLFLILYCVSTYYVWKLRLLVVTGLPLPL
eukprot:m51a1_g558 hypothetical protein (209) ;mRNA; f:483885-484780